MLFVKGAEQRRQIGIDNDEELLQFAVRQSLLETGAEEDQVSYYTIYLYLNKINFKIINIFFKKVDIWEALQVQRPNTPNDLYFDPADEELQRYKHVQTFYYTYFSI